MTATEKIFYILQEIKEANALSPKGKLSQIDVRRLNEDLSRQDLEQIFEKLEEEFKILEIHTRANYDYEFHYRFYILDGFDEIYNKYSPQATPSLEIPLTNSDLIESLERRVSGFFHLSERGFFLGIADYVKFIDENSGFQPIVETIEMFKNRDGAKLDELGKKLLEDVAIVEKNVFERIEKANVKSPIVYERIKQYEMTKDGRMQSGAPRAEAFHDGIALVISSLCESGYITLVEDYIIPFEGGTSISDFKISKNYYPFIQELSEFKSKFQKTIWGSWNELVIVYLVIHKYQEHTRELKDKNDVVGEMNFYGLHGEMANVLGNAHNDSSRLQFIKEDYVIHINRVHDFIINKLKSNPDKEIGQDDKKTILSEPIDNIFAKREEIVLNFGHITYQEKRGKLQFKENSPIDVQPTNQDVKYLALLLKANGEIVRNSEAAKYLGLNSYHENVTDRDMSLEIQAIKKKVKALLLRCGMSSNEVDTLIKSIKGMGYKLNV